MSSLKLTSLSQNLMPKLRKIKSLSITLGQKFRAKRWAEKSIVYYCPPTDTEPWTGDSLKTGIGGSQIAVIYLTQHWVQKGFEVTVYNNCQAHSGIYESVKYVDYRHFNPQDKFSHLIVWRMPWRMAFPNQAKKVYLDVHETLIPEQRSRAKVNQYDRIFLKSEYQRKLFSDTPDTQAIVIPNGVEETYTNLLANPKSPHRLIYASNYSRGLEQMLEYGWPLIHQAIPQAELHVYYGWSTPKKKVEEYHQWRKKMESLLEQPNVFEHGRVGQQALMLAKASSAIHYYGCTFEEIDCISIRESALVGAVPVTTDYAVFQEKKYCIKVSGNPKLPETQKELASKIIALLQEPHYLEELRSSYAQMAQQETWQRISDKWLERMTTR
jgi:hypothetical protein